MGTIDHSDPDHRPAWEAMNRYGGRNRLISEAVFGCWPEAFGDQVEFMLAELYMRAFMAGAKHGRAVTHQMFIGNHGVTS